MAYPFFFNATAQTQEEMTRNAAAVFALFFSVAEALTHSVLSGLEFGLKVQTQQHATQSDLLTLESSAGPMNAFG